jgi:phage regulator Rha-like protein
MGEIALQNQTMSSREIAELTGKRHPDVSRDVENMLAELGVDVSKTAHIYLDSMNREQTEYQLDQELTFTLITGYSVALRNKVVKRWLELEAKASAQAALDFGHRVEALACAKVATARENHELLTLAIKHVQKQCKKFAWDRVKKLVNLRVQQLGLDLNVDWELSPYLQRDIRPPMFPGDTQSPAFATLVGEVASSYAWAADLAFLDVNLKSKKGLALLSGY